jgi:hypothetical protein
VLALGLFDYFKDPTPASGCGPLSSTWATFTRWDWVKAPSGICTTTLNRCRTFDYTEERQRQC